MSTGDISRAAHEGVPPLPEISPLIPSKEGQINSFTDVRAVESQIKGPKWNERALTYLEDNLKKLDASQNKIQKALDGFYENKLKPLFESKRAHKINSWIDDNGYGKWYQQLAVILAKAPIRAVRNVLRVVYNIFKGLVYGFIHPIKALNKLAQLFIKMIDAMSKPETWTKIGAGMIGAAAGQAILFPGPQTIIGLGVGGCLIGAGLIFGSIKSALQAEKGEGIKSVKKELSNQIKGIPEFAATGFLMGFMIGGILKEVHLTQINDIDHADYLFEDFSPDKR